MGSIKQTEDFLKPLLTQAPTPKPSRCSSSFSVRRCPALTPRRPSWPDGTCSTPPPPASRCILDRLCRPSFSHHVTRGRRSGSSSRLLIGDSSNRVGNLPFLFRRGKNNASEINILSG